MYLIITNNRKVLEDYENTRFVEGDFKKVLTVTRDLIYEGHKLLTHPLPPSSRMFFSPVRSIIIEREKTILDEDSAEVIANSIDLYLKNLGSKSPDDKNLEDYERIDHYLLVGAVEELGR